MALPCVPTIIPTGHAFRAIRHVAHHRAASLTHHGHGVGTSASAHVHHAHHAHHAIPHVVAQPTVVPASCGVSAGPLPAGPLAGAKPVAVLGKTGGASAGFGGAPISGGGFASGGVGAGSGGLGGGAAAAGGAAAGGAAGGVVGGLLASAKAMAVAGGLLAAGFGAGAAYLEQTDAFNPAFTGRLPMASSPMLANALAAPLNLADAGTPLVQPGTPLAPVMDTVGAPGPMAAGPSLDASTPNSPAPTLLAPTSPETVTLPPQSPSPSAQADRAPEMTAVPEPASLLTFMVGGLACLITRRRGVARRRVG